MFDKGYWKKMINFKIDCNIIFFLIIIKVKLKVCILVYIWYIWMKNF